MRTYTKLGFDNEYPLRTYGDSMLVIDLVLIQPNLSVQNNLSSIGLQSMYIFTMSILLVPGQVKKSKRLIYVFTMSIVWVPGQVKMSIQLIYVFNMSIVWVPGQVKIYVYVYDTDHSYHTK